MAETIESRLGIRAVHIPCPVLRDNFYVADRHRDWNKQSTLYEVLRTGPTADPAQLRLAFKIRQLELQKQAPTKATLADLERAYNILANPDLRACYDALLKDPEAPVLFPYSGFGSLLVGGGDRSRDGRTFFATRILAFRPETRQRRFRAPLRKFDFYPRPCHLSGRQKETGSHGGSSNHAVSLGPDLEPMEAPAGGEGGN